MKKGLVLLVASLAVVFCFSACGDAGVYKQAGKAMEEGNYAQVIELLDTIPDYEDADGLRAHADAVIAFQEAAGLVEEKNVELDAVIDAAQALLSSGEVPLEASTATDLQVAISGAEEAKRQVPAMAEATADIAAQTQEMNAPIDYSAQVERLTAAQAAMADSVAQMKQVTNPTGDFVISRISELEDIDEIRGVTEENDPNGNLNKPGGYTSATYFTSPLVDQTMIFGADPIEKGAEGGGCIEVYATAEDADIRDQYLAAFDGAGMLSAGSHAVCGTVVIRTADSLTATQQTELTEQIREKLTELK